MALFKKNDELFRAVQWTGDNVEEVAAVTGAWSAKASEDDQLITDAHLYLVPRGNWLTLGAEATDSCCSSVAPDVFAATYEAAEG